MAKSLPKDFHNKPVLACIWKYQQRTINHQHQAQTLDFVSKLGLATIRVVITTPEKTDEFFCEIGLPRKTKVAIGNIGGSRSNSQNFRQSRIGLTCGEGCGEGCAE